MIANESKNTGYYKAANICAVIIIIFLGIGSFVDSVFYEKGMQEAGTSEGIIGLGMGIALVLLIPVFRSTTNFSSLAFFTPFIIFAYNALIMILSGWSPYFLIVCLYACGISCLYSNYPLTLAYTTLQIIAVVVLYAMGYPIAGTEVSLSVLLVSAVVFIFSSVIILLLARSATVSLGKALDDGNSFRTFLATTANYLAMVDGSNQVVYVSKPLSDLAGIEDTELAGGRSFVDLFPGRDLKLLAGDMLGQRGLYEKDWEFVLNGQKRYFKAASNTLVGTSRGTLINLHDMTYLAERDEIATMRDSLKIGLFFLNRSIIIQENYSRFLEELLSERDLGGKNFIDLLSNSVNPREQDAIKDYLDMVFNHTFDQAMLNDINPLNELHYVSKNRTEKIFHCEFVTVERAHGELFVLATVYDITAKVELQQRLREEETRRQEEMRTIFELIQVDPSVFQDFMADAEHEFSQIDEILKNDKLTAREALVNVYQSVHAIKSNAVILGLNTFGDNVHSLESEIKELREQKDEVTFDDMLHLTVAIERLSEKKEGFRDIIEKINSFKLAAAGGQKQNQYIFVESLTKAADRASSDIGKKVKFIVDEIDAEAIDSGPRRLMKEVALQLVRNAVAHGIELPEERLAKGKKETGLIRLSVKSDGKMIHIKLLDDGQGLDFDKIREKALDMNLIKKEDENNKNMLLQAIFSPGFSTAQDEGVHAGRGIGLNLVRDRVRNAKGTIKLQTESDRGTVFNIFLPLDSAD
ncbi:MAG: ATP-binding protein [Treponema sp.]|nr:ATP-binding protein [Treponema sp.]